MISHPSLTSLIARGSWGGVYAGTGSAGAVAVRVVDENVIADAALVQRFAASVRRAAKLDSPHVLPIYELHHGDNTVLIVMPQCPSNLGDQPAPVDVGDACVAGLSLLRGLTAAHEVGVLHGDLNARNALIDAKNRVVLSDIGLGAALRTAEQTARLRLSELIGLAPEQVLGDATGTYTDTYAVASLLYTMIGARTIRATGGDFGSLVTSIAAGEAITPLASVSAVPAAIADVIDTGLATDPAQRFASAQSMFDALEEAARSTLGPQFVESSRFVLE